jgi:hypothetical protein
VPTHVAMTAQSVIHTGISGGCRFPVLVQSCGIEPDAPAIPDLAGKPFIDEHALFQDISYQVVSVIDVARTFVFIFSRFKIQITDIVFSDKRLDEFIQIVGQSNQGELIHGAQEFVRGVQCHRFPRLQQIRPQKIAALTIIEIPDADGRQMGQEKIDGPRISEIDNPQPIDKPRGTWIESPVFLLKLGVVVVIDPTYMRDYLSYTGVLRSFDASSHEKICAR